MNLPGFPVAQRGETFASVVARFLERSAAPRTLLLEMLGLYLASPSSAVPHNLRQFASVLPEGHPWAGAPEVIAKGHTLVPLFLHFAHPERASVYRWESLLRYRKIFSRRDDSAPTASHMTSRPLGFPFSIGSINRDS